MFRSFVGLSLVVPAVFGQNDSEKARGQADVFYDHAMLNSTITTLDMTPDATHDQAMDIFSLEFNDQPLEVMAHDGGGGGGARGGGPLFSQNPFFREPTMDFGSYNAHQPRDEW